VVGFTLLFCVDVVRQLVRFLFGVVLEPLSRLVECVWLLQAMSMPLHKIAVD
jgi:hypothetical protein